MLAAIAMVVFIIAAVVGWVDKTISLAHLIAIIAVGLAFVAAHFAFRLWRPDSHW